MGEKSFKPAVLIMAKAPVPGYVKTRMEPDLSPQQCAGLQDALIRDLMILQEELEPEVDVWIAYSPADYKEYFQQFTSNIFVQEGVDLGARMRNGFGLLFKKGYGPVVVIGTDTPLKKEDIHRAFHLLQKEPLALGPALDGGYYLLGLHEVHPQLFEDISWGTNQVLAQTSERIKQLRLQVALLERKADIDDMEGLMKYLGVKTNKHFDQWRKDFFAKEWDCQEIGDGNMNLVFRIRPKSSAGKGDYGKSVIIKQAIPYIRSVGESWPLTTDRARIEYEALCKERELCPDRVPEIYHYDQGRSLIVMEDLSSHVILRKGLIDGKRCPFLAEHMGVFLARTLFLTSEFALDAGESERLSAQFANPELCRLSEDFIFTYPFMDHEMNRFNPLLKKDVGGIWNNRELKSEIRMMKQKFMMDKQALIHGDLHTGSIMVTEKDTKVIDPEFAFYGPMGFDLGAFMANVLLNYVSRGTETVAGAKDRDYLTYLLGLVEDCWIIFEREFRLLWKETSQAVSRHEMDLFLQQLYEDSLGFAGCKMLRRVIGTSHVEDLERIVDDRERAEAEKRVLKLGQNLVLQRKEIKDRHRLIQFVKRV